MDKFIEFYFNDINEQYLYVPSNKKKAFLNENSVKLLESLTLDIEKKLEQDFLNKYLDSDNYQKSIEMNAIIEEILGFGDDLMQSFSEHLLEKSIKNGTLNCFEEIDVYSSLAQLKLENGIFYKELFLDFDINGFVL